MMLEYHRDSQRGRWWIPMAITRASTWTSPANVYADDGWWAKGGRWSRGGSRDWIMLDDPSPVLRLVFPHACPIPDGVLASARAWGGGVLVDQVHASCDLLLSRLAIRHWQYVIAPRRQYHGPGPGDDTAVLAFAEASDAVAFRLAHVL